MLGTCKECQRTFEMFHANDDDWTDDVTASVYVMWDCPECGTLNRTTILTAIRLMAGEEKMTFDKWFVEQHGPRPGGDRTEEEIIDALVYARREAEEAKSLLHMRRSWEAQRASALWAWREAKDLTNTTE